MDVRVLQIHVHFSYDIENRHWMEMRFPRCCRYMYILQVDREMKWAWISPWKRRAMGSRMHWDPSHRQYRGKTFSKVRRFGAWRRRKREKAFALSVLLKEVESDDTEGYCRHVFLLLYPSNGFLRDTRETYHRYNTFEHLTPLKSRCLASAPPGDLNVPLLIYFLKNVHCFYVLPRCSTYWSKIHASRSIFESLP